MKTKIVFGIAMALTINVCMQSAEASSPTAQASYSATRTSPRSYGRWPKWYYYDQLGLKEWNKGEQKRAMAYFDESFRAAENDTLLRTRGGSLEPTTKKLIKEVINHQLFHMSLWQSAPTSQMQQKMSGADQAAVTAQSYANDVEKNLKWLDRLEQFTIKTLGKKTTEVQNIQLYRTKYFNFKDENERITRALRGAKTDPGRYTTGPATRDDERVWDQVNVPRPDWWKKNERDFTPETFTRDPKDVKDKKAAEPYEKRKSVLDASNPHGNPDAKYTPGVSYDAGNRFEPHKKNPGQGPGWASGSGAGQVDDGTQRPTGWGTANQGEQRPKNVTEWGVERNQMDFNREKKQPAWGSVNDDKEKESQQNWGGGGGGNPDEKKNQW